MAAKPGPVEQPVHRLPNGQPTTAPNKSNLEKLPSFSQPNVSLQNIKGANAGFASISGFVGVHDGTNVTVNGSEPEPPDQGLAVNNNVAVEINNNVMQIFNATTGASLAGPIATSVFFQAPNGTFLSDTQAFFDPTTQRWFLTELIYDLSSIEDIAVAVSQTSSATGPYYIYHVRAFSNDLAGCGANDCLPDYPKAGYDANILIVDVDLFNSTNNNFVAAAGYVLPKSVLITGASFSYNRQVFPNDFVVQPSIPAPGEAYETGANGTEYLMEARNISDGSNNIRVWAISNTNNIVSSPGSLKGEGVDVAAESYGDTVPSIQPNVIGPYCSSVGVTSAPTLDGGYNAFQSTIQKASGRLYGALAFGSNDGNGLARDIIAWFALTPSVNGIGFPSASIAQQGYIVPTNGYSLSYPAFGLNKSGAGMLGMTTTNQSANVPGGYPSASIIQFTGTQFTGSILVTGPGATSDDGFTGCDAPGPGGVGRWGDYGAAVVDAATGYLYAANEMIPNPATYPRGQFANWGTFITQSTLMGNSSITDTHDFNGDGKSDVAWFNNGTVAIWLMNGSSVSSVGIPGSASGGWSVVGQRDFNGDGKADLLWYNGGNVAAWFMNGTAVSSVASYGNVGSAWTVAGTGDFNGDGKGDILWTDIFGDVAMWLMNGSSVSTVAVLGNVGSAWTVAGVADFNGDGKADVLWRDTAGNVAIWLMNGTSVSSVSVLGNVSTNWSIVGTGDFDGDGHADILWRDTAGDLAIWFMNGTSIKSVAGLGNVSPTWSITQTGDYNGGGKSDILWTDTSGNLAAWFMNGSSVSSVAGLGNVSTAWQIQGANAD